MFCSGRDLLHANLEADSCSVSWRWLPAPHLRRCFGAMAVEHSEALLTVLDACSNEELNAHCAGQLLRGIAVVLLWGPPALAIDQRLQVATAKCLGLVPQVGGL